jgi:hypothetical protein
MEIIFVLLSLSTLTTTELSECEYISDTFSCESTIISPFEFFTHNNDSGVPFVWRAHFTPDNRYRILVFDENELLIIEGIDDSLESDSEYTINKIVFENHPDGNHLRHPLYSQNLEYALFTGKDTTDVYTHYLVNAVTCDIDTLPFSSPGCPRPSNDGSLATVCFSVPRLGMIPEEFAWPRVELSRFNQGTGQFESTIILSDVSFPHVSRNHDRLLVFFFDGTISNIEAYDEQGNRNWSILEDGYEQLYLASTTFIRRCGSALRGYLLSSGEVVWEDNSIDYSDTWFNKVKISMDEHTIGLQFTGIADSQHSSNGSVLLLQHMPDSQLVILSSLTDMYGELGSILLRSVSDNGRLLFSYHPDRMNPSLRKYIITDESCVPIWHSSDSAVFTSEAVFSQYGDRIVYERNDDKLIISTTHQNTIEETLDSL